MNKLKRDITVGVICLFMFLFILSAILLVVNTHKVNKAKSLVSELSLFYPTDTFYFNSFKTIMDNEESIMWSNTTGYIYLIGNTLNISTNGSVQMSFRISPKGEIIHTDHIYLIYKFIAYNKSTNSPFNVYTIYNYDDLFQIEICNIGYTQLYNKY